MKKYRLKKNVKMVLYKAGIVLVCLLLLLNVSDLSRLEGIFAADSNISFQAVLLKAIDGAGTDNIEVQSGEAFYVKSSYTINSLGGGQENVYTAGTLALQIPEKAVFDEAATRELMQTRPSIFTDFVYNPTNHLITFTTNGDFNSGMSGSLYMVFHYSNMTTENDYHGIFRNIQFTASTSGGAINPIQMGDLTVVNKASQTWDIQKGIEQQNGQDYIYDKTKGTYRLKYKLQVNPGGNADRYGRLECTTFQLTDKLPAPFTSEITNGIAQGYPSGGGASSIRIIANENEDIQRELKEGADYTLTKAADGTIAEIHIQASAMNTSAGNTIDAGTMVGTTFQVYADYDYSAYEIPFNERDINGYLLNNQLQLTYQPLMEAEQTVKAEASAVLGWRDENPGVFNLNIQKQIRIGVDALLSGSGVEETRNFDERLQEQLLAADDRIEFHLYKDKGTTVLAKDKDGNTVQPVILRKDQPVKDGLFSFDHLLAGTYYLKETMNFQGFQEPSVKKIVIAKDGGIHVDGKPVAANAPVTIVNTADEKGFGYVAFWKKGTTAISKDAKQYLQNITFQLISETDSTKTYTAVSDAHGLVLFQGIPAGKYSLKEIDRGDGEFESPSNDWKVTVTGNQVNYPVKANNEALNKDENQKPYIENISQKGGLKIIKVDKKDKEKKLTGAEFMAYGPYDTKAAAEAADTKGQKGIAITSEFTDGNTYYALAKGWYAFVETKAPNGYAVADGRFVSEIQANQINSLQIENEKMITLTVAKTGQLSADKPQPSEPLSGAQFRVYTDKECTQAAQDYTNPEEPKDAVLTTYISGGKSTSNAVMLRKGISYWIKETKAPQGYEMDKTVRLLSELLDTDKYEFIYEAKNIATSLGLLKIIKQDASDSAIKLEGVEFEIYDEAGNKVDTVRTNSEGIAESVFLNDGRYKIKEISQPEGYSKTAKGKLFMGLDAQGKAITEGTGIEVKKNTVSEVIVENEPLVAYTIKKTDDKSNPLAGVSFKLYPTKQDAENDTNGKTYTTAASGELRFEKLEPQMEYFYRETKTASDDYILDDAIKSFTSPGKGTAYKQQEEPPLILNEKYGDFRITKKLQKFNSEEVSETLSGIKFKYFPKLTEDVTQDLYWATSNFTLRTAETGSDGTFTSEKLKPGTYWLVEEEDERYEKADPITITVVSGTTVEQEVINKTSLGMLKIKKVSSMKLNNKEVVITGGARFEIYKYVEGYTYADYRKNKPIEAFDIKEKDGIHAVTLKPDTYAVLEVTPIGTNMEYYTPDLNTVYKVEVSANKLNNSLVSTPVENTPKGRFYLKKEEIWGYGTAAERRLNQVMTFGIYRDAECKDEVTAMTSSTAGAILSPHLDAGTYYVKEKLTAAQKEIYGEPQAKLVHVKAGQNHMKGYAVNNTEIGGKKANPLSFENIPKKSKMLIKKVDRETKAPLNKAKFSVFQEVDKNTKGVQKFVINGVTHYFKKVSTVNSITGTADVTNDGNNDKGYAFTEYFNPDGVYYLREWQAPAGYQREQEWIGPITLEKGELKEITIENFKPQGALGSKVNQKQELIKEKGIQIALLQDEKKAETLKNNLLANPAAVLKKLENQNNWDSMGVLQIASTNDNGYFVFKNLNIEKTYYALEVKTLDAYERDPNVHTVTVREVNGAYQLYEEDEEFQLMNRERGQLLVQKIVTLSGVSLPLDDVTFDIYKAKDQHADSSDLTTEGNAMHYVTGTYQSGNNGAFLTDWLTPGWYIVKEVAVPEGIEQPGTDKVWRIEVKEGEINKELYDTPIENIAHYGKFYFQKVKDTDTRTLLHAVFRLERYDDQTKKFKTYTDKVEFDKAVGVYESDYLPAGTYRLIETEVEDGYSLATAPVEFKIEANKITGMKDGVIQPLDAYSNQPILIKNREKGSLNIRKVGILIEGESPSELNGITFRLYRNLTNDPSRDIRDENFVAEAVSASGHIKIQNLDAGSYWLKETEVNAANKELGYVEGKLAEVHIEPGKETVTLKDGSDFINASTYGKLKIKKTDAYSKEGLKHAVFDVYANKECTGEPVDTITTGAAGTSYTKMLPAGSYWLREKESPNGYLLSNAVYGPYEINSQQITDGGEIDNKPLQSVRIKKIDAATREAVPEKYMKPAMFAIYLSEKDAKAEENEIQRVSGDEELLFTNLLPDQTYWIKELTPPDGYTKRKEPVSVTTGTANGDAAVLEKEIENSAQGSILIEKNAQWMLNADDSRKLPLSKVTFTLTKADDPEFSMQKETDSDGFAEFRGLEQGIYTLIETVPEGFKEDGVTTTWSLEVTAGKQNKELTGEKAIINNPIQGKFTFQKTTINEKHIANVKEAQFTLEKHTAGETWQVVSGYEAFHVDDSAGSFESGMLAAGSYRLSEKQAPSGFAVMKPIEFTIQSSQITEVVSAQKSTVENEALGNVKIIKYSDSYLYDEAGTKYPMQGVAFTLKGNEVFQTVRSDAHGVCEWKNLVPGEYTIEETKMEGYEQLEQMHVTVAAGQSEIKTYYPQETDQGEIYNTATHGRLVIHKTDEAGKPLQGAEFQIFKADGTPITTTPLLSDENGYAISELLEADEKGTTYIVEETKAPVGYTLDDRYYPLKKKVVVKPLQSSDIILENQKADAKASNYITFLNKPQSFYEDFQISVAKQIQQADTTFTDAEIPESQTSPLLGTDQNAVFRINGYAEGTNEIDAERVTVSDTELYLYYMNNGRYEKETAAANDYTIDRVTVYPAYAGDIPQDSDPVHAVLEYQTFGSSTWTTYEDSKAALKNLQKASSTGVTMDVSSLQAVHFRIVYQGTKKKFHAGGIEFSVTFQDRSAIAASDVHEIRKAGNRADVEYLYNIKNESATIQGKTDHKTSNEVAIYFPLRQNIAPKASLQIKTDNGTSFAPGDIVYYTITAENRSGGLNPANLEKPIISFDLPQGTSFVNDYKNMGRNLLVLYGAEDDAQIIEPDEMEVIITEDVPVKEINDAGELVDTGKTTTKVTIKLKDLAIDTSNKLYVKFAAQISQSPSVSGLLAPSYLTSGASLPLSAENPYGNAVEFDVSSGGDVVEDKALDNTLGKPAGGKKYAYSGVDVRVKASNNLNVYKEVKGQYDKTYLSSANTGSTAPGGSISYTIVLQNGASDQRIKKARVVDILPFKGDTLVTRTNTGGKATERGSELAKRPILKDVSVSAMDGSEVTQPYTIYYCVSTGVSEEALTAEWTKSERERTDREYELPMLYDSWEDSVWENGAHHWQTDAPADMRTVTAVAVEFDTENQPLGSYEGFRVHIEMQAPSYSTDELAAMQDKLIKNSAMGAVQRFGTDGKSIDLSDTVENDPVKVKLILAKGSIGDYAFFDRNKDGIQDSGDIPVTGLQVTLHTYKTYRNERGELIKTELDQKQTQTNQLGYYRFDNLDCNEQIAGTADADDPNSYVGNAIYSYRVEFATPQDESRYAYEPTIRFAISDNTSDSNITQEKKNQKTINISDEIRLATQHTSDGSISGEDNMTIDAGFIALGAVGDTVWIDKNRNGIQDSDEPGVSDVTVRLYRVDDAGHSGAAIMETKTDHTGSYLFSGLCAGSYVVEFDISKTNSYGYTSYTFTTPYVLQDASSDIDSNARLYGVSKTLARSDVFTLNDHAVDLSIDAGLTYYSALSGYCFEDRNYNNIQDIGIALPSTIVELYQIDESGKRKRNPLRTATVGKDGTYFFDHLEEGYYQVKFHFPNGFEAVEAHQGNEEIDSDVSDELDELRQYGYTPVFYIAPNSLEEHWDAGAVRYGSIGDYVWQDLNKNGVQENGEPPVSGVPVYLQMRHQGESTWSFYAAAETNAHGRYVFEGLQGSAYTGIEYRVVFDLPYDTKLTTPLAAADIRKDSNALARYMNGWGFPTDSIQLGYGQHDMTWDAGIIQTSGSVGDYVWFDENKNGIQDEEATGIAGIRVILERNDSEELNDQAWEYVGETTTNHAGYYRFDDLHAGYYRVKFYLKGYAVTLPLTGDDAALDSDGYDKKQDWYLTRPFYLEDGGFDMTWDCGVYNTDGSAAFTRPMISQTINGPVQTADTTKRQSPLVAGLSLVALLVLGRKLHRLKKEI